MNQVVTTCIGGYVLFPIECKNDVINFNIPTPFRATLDELAEMVLAEDGREEKFAKEARK